MIDTGKYRVYWKMRQTASNRQTAKESPSLSDARNQQTRGESMKNNEVLRYPLADIGPESPVMTVRLHRTPSGYWRFDVRYNHQIDIADRLFNSLAEHAGLEEKVMSLFNRIPRKGRCYPCLYGCSALFCSGQHFPNRESVVNLIENAYLPCWRYAVDKIMENHTSGDSWLHAVRKTERQYWSVVNRTAPTEK